MLSQREGVTRIIVASFTPTEICEPIESLISIVEVFFSSQDRAEKA